MKKLLFVFGTRPEAIKLAPVILAAKKDPRFCVKVLVTGQHRLMLDQVLNLFNIVPDYDLNLMKSNQSLNDIVSGVIQGVDTILKREAFDYVLVQGDTSTAMAGALSAFHHKVPVAHIEAGLRTNNLHSPFPEEMNRQVITRLATIHFVPTESGRLNLLAENVQPGIIQVTGNTVIDALLIVQKTIKEQQDIYKSLKERFSFIDPERKMVLVTGHRRENFGENFKNICLALKKIADTFPDVQLVYPVHLNPQVRKPALEILSGVNSVHLLEPQEYLPFVFLMMNSYLIISDSGGIQEEAPSLGKPVLVTRNNTERSEAVKAGTVRLVGASAENIFNETKELLENLKVYQKMATTENPYGDGTASGRILSALH
ncbi:non-hydrolyzing UDP-N-acetylglucosamine 2-epimerase [Bdellovibrio reynosensis]|uniref:UDP-N-acetylglucosamine 2-epimerase (non-hydrolyzing) n=1 Tax=Bdellovibrio reynosensis TaxID=2835041 RepID=A0ABY4CBG1_9BACT|nr:UDP-N-acetylglucosamine 2-epimerase (non-hydrolyzing) [Bdellovibrio reynosensis]UOF02250.1 UDP-N-acetylglucosamine 2-epimerase (non-hydrolyzing) [Bdellovibrio reynosensis]